MKRLESIEVYEKVVILFWRDLNSYKLSVENLESLDEVMYFAKYCYDTLQLEYPVNVLDLFKLALDYGIYD